MQDSPPQQSPTLRIELSPENVRHIAEVVREHKKSRFGAISLTVTIFLGIMGYFVTWYLDYLNVKEQQLREQIQRKIEVYNSVMETITNFRSVRYEIQLECEHDANKITDRNFNYFADKRRLEAEMKMIDASNLAYHAFAGDGVSIGIRTFDEWDEKVKNYCEPTAPNDDEYRNRLAELEEKMRASIKRDQENLLHTFSVF